MLLLKFLLIFISLLGCFEFAARRLKINSAYIPAFTVATFSIFILISGICGNLDFICYIFFYFGLGAFVFYVIDAIRNKKQLTSQYLCGHRKEFVLLLGILFPIVMVLTDVDFEYFLGDHYTAWYQHFLYLVRNNKWSDRGYVSFCSRYTMITHGFSYYICRMLGIYNSPPYLAAGVIMSVFGGFALCRSIRWRHFSYFSGLIIFSIIFIYITNAEKYADFRVFALDKQPIVVLCSAIILYYGLRSLSRIQRIDLIKFTSAILIVYLIMYAARQIHAYVIDAILTCSLACMVTMFLDLSQYHSRKYTRMIIAMIPISIFITLIKPGELMYTILLPVCFLISMILESLIKSRFRVKKFLTKKKLFYLIIYSLLFFAPVLGYKAWGVYANYCDFKIQHENGTFADTLNKFRRHIKHGLTNEETVKYNAFRKHLYWSPWGVPGKIYGEFYSFMEMCNRYCERYLSWGLNLDTPKRLLNLFFLTYLMLATMIVGIIFSPPQRILRYGIQGLFLFLIVGFVYFVHIYYGPLHLNLQPSFRYFAPAFCMFLVAGSFFAFSTMSTSYRHLNFRIVCIIPILAFCNTFGLGKWTNSQKDTFKIMPEVSIYPLVNYDWCKDYPIIFTCPNPEATLSLCLYRNFDNFNNKPIKIYISTPILKEDEKYILCVGRRINMGGGIRLVGASGPGVYIVQYTSRGRTLRVIEKKCDVKGLQKLKEQYPLRNVRNWSF